MLRSVFFAAVLGTAASAQPHEAYRPPTTMYERDGNRLLFGGVGNPTSISAVEVPQGYEVRVRNTLTPMDFNVVTFAFDIPDGEVVVTYTLGPSETPDAVSVAVPNGWIAIPFDIILEEEGSATILITPYLPG